MDDFYGNFQFITCDPDSIVFFLKMSSVLKVI